jgi:hypothetical protein
MEKPRKATKLYSRQSAQNQYFASTVLCLVISKQVYDVSVQDTVTLVYNRVILRA